jgi:hypothetical protein
MKRCKHIYCASIGTSPHLIILIEEFPSSHRPVFAPPPYIFSLFPFYIIVARVHSSCTFYESVSCQLTFVSQCFSASLTQSPYRVLKESFFYQSL